MLTRLTIRQLQMIRALEKAGSVSAAAQLLQVSQSALSHRIREAERLLGADLYLRQNKRLIPTVTGQRVAHAANSILDELERTEQDIAQLQSGVERNLRLGLHMYASSLWLPELMADMAQRAPTISVQLCADTGLDPIGALRAHSVDVALVSGQVTSHDLMLEKLLDDELVAVMAADHAWAQWPSVDGSAFAQQTYVAHHTNPETGREYEQVFSANNILPKRVIRAGVTEAVIAMVSQNLGVTLLPRRTAQAYAQQYQLQLKSLSGEQKTLPWQLVYSKQSHNDEAMQQFMAAMKSVWA